MNRGDLAVRPPVRLYTQGGWQASPVACPELLTVAHQTHSLLAPVSYLDLGLFCSTYSSRKCV
jgi:hypothetical protein